MKYAAQRRRRGVRDTLEDFAWWLKTWKRMLSFLSHSPRRTVRGLKKYALGESFISVPALVDGFVGSASGARLREKHEEIDGGLKRCLDCAGAVFAADESIGGSGAERVKTVCVDGERAAMIMQGFPNVRTAGLSALTFIFGRDGEELPRACACSIVSCPREQTPKKQKAPPPVFELTGEAENIIACIRFAEKQTGERFDWDEFTGHMCRMTGERGMKPAAALKRLSEFQ